MQTIIFKFKILLSIVILLGYVSYDVSAQSGNCDPNTPFFAADLTGNPDSIWISPSESRSDNCCGSSNPDRCIEFEILLDVNAMGIAFNIASGAVPTGSMFYQINCGATVAVGDPVCLDGVGPHVITFCKPGNNQNTYSFVSIPKNIVARDTFTRAGCAVILPTVTGIIESTTTWTDLSGNGYEQYLDNPSGSLNPLFSPPTNAPTQIQFQVCGESNSNLCAFSTVTICDTVTIDISPAFEASVSSPIFCSTDTDYRMSVFTSQPSYHYDYLWMSQGNGNGSVLSTNIDYTYHSLGTYSVIVIDSDYGNCASDTVTFTIVEAEEPIVFVNEKSCNPADTGSATVVYTSSQGCDSTVVTTIFLANSYVKYVYIETCNIPDTGTVSNTYTTIDGCDSTVYTIKYLPPNSSTVYQYSCNPADTGTSVQVLTNIYGCDSTVTTIVGLLQSQSTILNESICDGDSYEAAGQTHTASGTYNYTLQTWQGCDSTVTLNLVLDTNITYIQTESCHPADTGIFIQNLFNINNCDSTVYTIVSLLPTSYTTIYDTICSVAYFFNNDTLTTTGTYYDTLVAANSCDSIIILELYAFAEICNNGIDDDCDGYVDEFDTDCDCDNDNFFGQCFPDCEAEIEIDSLAFKVDWISSGDVPNYQSPLIADIDNDGIPEMIIQSTNSHKTSSDRSTKDILIINGQTGVTELTITTPYMPWGSVVPIAVGDVDNDGFGEIIISTAQSYNGTSDQGYLICYEHDGTQKWKSNIQIGQNAPRKFGTAVSLADFNGDGIPEVYVYNEIYNAQTGVLLAQGGSNGVGLHSNEAWGATATQIAADLTTSPGLELACGKTVYEVSITNTSGTTGNTMTPINIGGNYKDGYTAVADIDLDGNLDVVVSEFGAAGAARVYVWNPRTISLIAATAFADFTTTGYNFTGTVFIGDMDNDCEPEIGFTRSLRVYAYDYNGTTTLQQKWQLLTSDLSGLTGITMFDFNNDGQQELLYRDETQLRVLDGSGSSAFNLFWFIQDHKFSLRLM